MLICAHRHIRYLRRQRRSLPGGQMPPENVPVEFSNVVGICCGSGKYCLIIKFQLFPSNCVTA